MSRLPILDFRLPTETVREFLFRSSETLALRLRLKTWTLDFGPWTLDFRPWTLDFGL